MCTFAKPAFRFIRCGHKYDKVNVIPATASMMSSFHLCHVIVQNLIIKCLRPRANHALGCSLSLFFKSASAA